MEIILLEKIEKLGQMGDVVQVKAGYARNYLLPQGKGLRATEANKKHFEGQRALFGSAFRLVMFDSGTIHVYKSS